MKFELDWIDDKWIVTVEGKKKEFKNSFHAGIYIHNLTTLMYRKLENGSSNSSVFSTYGNNICSKFDVLPDESGNSQNPIRKPRRNKRATSGDGKISKGD